MTQTWPRNMTGAFLRMMCQTATVGAIAVAMCIMFLNQSHAEADGSHRSIDAMLYSDIDNFVYASIDIDSSNQYSANAGPSIRHGDHDSSHDDSCGPQCYAAVHLLVAPRRSENHGRRRDWILTRMCCHIPDLIKSPPKPFLV